MNTSLTQDETTMIESIESDIGLIRILFLCRNELFSARYEENSKSIITQVENCLDTFKKYREAVWRLDYLKQVVENIRIVMEDTIQKEGVK
jgi:hypothetical protein